MVGFAPEARVDRRPRDVEARLRRAGSRRCPGPSAKPDDPLGPEPATSQLVCRAADPTGCAKRLLDQYVSAAVAQVVAGDDRVTAVRAGVDHLGDRVVTAVRRRSRSIPTLVTSSRSRVPGDVGERVDPRGDERRCGSSLKRTMMSGRPRRVRGAVEPGAEAVGDDDRGRQHRGRQRDPDAGEQLGVGGLRRPLARRRQVLRGAAVTDDGVRAATTAAPRQGQDAVGDRGRVGLVGDDHDRPAGRPRSSSSTAAPFSASRLPVGSSARTSSGSLTSARAMREALLLTAGELVRADDRRPLASPSSSISSAARARPPPGAPGQPRWQQHVLERRSAPRSAGTAGRRSRCGAGGSAPALRRGGRSAARLRRVTSPGVRGVEPAEEVQQRRLAAPRATEHGDHLVGLHGQSDPVEKCPRRPSVPHGLDEATRMKDRRTHSGQLIVQLMVAAGRAR